MIAFGHMDVKTLEFAKMWATLSKLTGETQHNWKCTHTLLLTSSRVIIQNSPETEIEQT